MKTIDIYLIKTGDVGLCIGTSELSQTIQKATDSIYSHTTNFIWIDRKITSNFKCRRFFT